MPIYAYRCASCGFEKDVLQKLSDAPLTQCPECGKDAFAKQVTAAGFQLKGSGWYVTDFRGGNSGGAAAKKPEGEGAKSENADSGSAAKSDAAAPSAEASKPASSAPASASGTSAAPDAA
jgi:putative FmdB family regulatory protein